METRSTRSNATERQQQQQAGWNQPCSEDHLAVISVAIEVLRMGIFSGYFRLAAAMFEGSNVQWRLRKSAFRIAVQLRRQLYSKLFAYYKRTNTCVKIC